MMPRREIYHAVGKYDSNRRDCITPCGKPYYKGEYSLRIAEDRLHINCLECLKALSLLDKGE